MKEAVIVSAVRTAVGKAPKGTLKNTRPDDMGATAIKEAVARVEGLNVQEVDDVIMGCAFPEAQQGMNVARTAMILAGLPVETSAMTVNRYCSSGLQTIAQAADRIKTGGAEIIVAGGLETMSMIAMGGANFRPNPNLAENYPDYYLNMGLTAENLAKKYEITREQADQFSLESHQKAAAAIKGGKFKDEIVPMNGRVLRKEVVFDTDEGVRYDASIEGFAKLKPVFHAQGTVTAGNSSQMSDGAAAAVVMSLEKAQALGLKPLARFVSYATAGCLPEEMGIGPVYAIPKALKMAGLTLDQIDVIELNEAFAAQGLSVMKVLEMNPAKVNVNGGAVALGHPLGCTGAKLTATLLQELKRTGGRYGMVTMCVGGGMGAAGIFERMD
jgi:acetyl-CoA acyltransferase